MAIFTVLLVLECQNIRVKGEHMSKHSNAEGKLHVSKEVRRQPVPIKQTPSPKDNSAPQVPPVGTNANNQYR